MVPGGPRPPYLAQNRTIQPGKQDKYSEVFQLLLRFPEMNNRVLSAPLAKKKFMTMFFKGKITVAAFCPDPEYFLTNSSIYEKQGAEFDQARGQ